MRRLSLILPSRALLALAVVCAAVLQLGSPAAAQAAPATGGGFTTDAAVAASPVAPGATVLITASVTSAAAATRLVDVEVFAPTGARVHQRYFDQQAFGAGQRRDYPVAWPAPATSGAYVVRVGVFSVGWGTLYHWNAYAATFAVADPTAPPPTGTRVMPLGDSLTDGYNIPGGYRTHLWGKFAADAVTVDFVGSLSNGPAGLGDKNHEGHSGWRIDEIAGQATGWMTSYRPEIVLLLIGTNDMAQNYNTGTAPDRLSALIDQLAAASPSAHVVVASIPRIGGSPGSGPVEAYNAAIPGIVAAKRAQGKRVAFVDMYAVIGVGDLHTDYTHMADSGNRKLADAWYPAIRAILGGGALPPPTATPAPPPTATPAPPPTATPAPPPTATPAPPPTATPAPPPTATPAPPPTFTTSAGVTPTSVARGAAVTTSVAVTSATAMAALVDVEIYDPAGKKVHQQVYGSQSFAAGQKRTYSFTWTAPTTAATGVYRVKVGVFKPDWGVLYHWNNAAAQFTVTS